MKQHINIVYIDDWIDPILNRYLDEFCNELNALGAYNYVLEFEEYTFKKEDSYKTLLNNKVINSANIIVIDSWLFENKSSSLSKFTGEQFKIILKKVLPFIKTIVISQNELDSLSLTIKKFKSNSSETYKQYYDKTLKPVVHKHILSIIEEFEVLEQLTVDEEVDPILVESIQSTIEGIMETTLFEKEDLDELIKLFKEVRGNYGD
ncbi:hypothetical protein SAMN04488542_13227 [Fontibacillus panacisegetis]|uniref:Uncharacterized protein n=1 Tax=Fontibacillus panacisegetis TaxID=670482 RepID=A0A1G7SWQ3_9BACL|nr:hypothetical protein [Fontibacillus panacisegetis]SDG26859.1 hypothetical protein SAMN04488542_13227 [Fontibacillus panacisegetis]